MSVQKKLAELARAHEAAGAEGWSLVRVFLADSKLQVSGIWCYAHTPY